MGLLFSQGFPAVRSQGLWGVVTVTQPDHKASLVYSPNTCSFSLTHTSHHLAATPYSLPGLCFLYRQARTVTYTLFPLALSSVLVGASPRSQSFLRSADRSSLGSCTKPVSCLCLRFLTYKVNLKPVILDPSSSLTSQHVMPICRCVSTSAGSTSPLEFP